MTAETTGHLRTSAPKRGLNGAIITAWGGRDLRLRVLARDEVAENFLRLEVDVDGLLARAEVYPTYWLRLWFTTPTGKGHQRAYTLVAPDPGTGTAWLEFFLHEGVASDWARDARIDDEIDATVLSGKNPVEDSPAHLLMIGDGASYPAIADTLRRCPDIPATVLLEQHHGEGPQIMALPERENAAVHWLAPDQEVCEVALEEAQVAPAGTRFFVALEGTPTRRLSSALRKQLGVPKESVHSLAYWKRR
ncbi:siderophore-interacting protein [Brachybacterium fresconis]|uniref:NADPH-dependent ferric siderophore reductase n=1 Tax=Brachybacterium fresconis TaxID=173363 RepID=A0ABS4YMM9_9MICO|nr:siderophore-interacting protein [Brachybacterium fresconis]MBP2409168.1 NADPH-dependent ferric siderophore reductase [Brachybacterium fresconis]